MVAASKDAGPMDDARKDQIAKTLCIGTAIFMTAVTMCVPTRAPMVLLIKKGSAAETARAMGLMSTCAAIIELIANPIIGKMSDEHGRKPFLALAGCVNAFLHMCVAANPMSLTTQFADRMISGSMIFGFLAPAQAALADLFATNPARLGVWGATFGMYFGMGTTFGPLLGSKLGGPKSFFGSALVFLASTLFMSTQLPETLDPANKKKFKFSNINPVAFLSLFRERTLGMLGITTALQSFGDYVNIYDINNLFMMKTLNYGASEIGNFAMVVGVSQIVGGKVTQLLVRSTSLKQAALFANIMWAIGMSIMGTARSTSQAYLALALWTFGHQRNNSVAAYMQKYGAKLDMGRAEIVASSGNLLAYVKVMIPLFYSNMFAWATSNGRNMPGMPYFVISVLTAVSQFAFMQAAPED